MNDTGEPPSEFELTVSLLKHMFYNNNNGGKLRCMINIFFQTTTKY